MADFPAMPLFTDAYMADTQHLTNEEHGVYLRLLMFAWRTPGCCLPDDDMRLALMVGLSPHKWSRIKPTIMAFWTKDFGNYSQKKLKNIRNLVAKKSAAQKKRADDMWAAKSLEANKDGDAGAYTTAMPGDMPDGCRTDAGGDATKTKTKTKVEVREEGEEVFDKSNPPPPVAEGGVSVDFLREVFRAVGFVDGSRLPKYWTAKSARLHVEKWLAAGLTEEQVLTAARASRVKHPEPPNGPKALDGFMEQAAAKPHGQASSPQAPAATQAEKMAFWAKNINGTGFIAASAITPTMASALVSAGLVTRERLRERGIQ